MNVNEEIKILAYLDGELEMELIEEIESLLDRDEEARTFYEKMKAVNIELKNEFNSPSVLAAEERIKDSFGESVSSEWTLFGINFGSILSFNNAAVASLSVCLTLLIVPNFMQKSISLDDIGIYEKEIVIVKIRGESDSISISLESLIKELIESKKRKGLFTTREGQTIEIVIEDAFKRRGKEYFYGSLTDINSNQKNFNAVVEEEIIIFYSD